MIAPLLLLLLLPATLVVAQEERWEDPTTGMTFLAIPKGCFTMGNPNALTRDVHYRLAQLGYEGPRFADEAPTHEVCLAPFWIGRTEVTADQWRSLMGEAPPSGQDQEPAAGISWQQAQEFAVRLSKRSGQAYRLPTEAEWEYACRAGVANDTPFDQHEDKVDRAWYSVSDYRLDQPSPVARLAANPWGLHDMLGNVWEWVEDSYRADAYQFHSRDNPLTDGPGPRVIRGASYRSGYRQVRCAARSDYPADQALRQIGFRLVREVRP